MYLTYLTWPELQGAITSKDAGKSNTNWPTAGFAPSRLHVTFSVVLSLFTSRQPSLLNLEGYQILLRVRFSAIRSFVRSSVGIILLVADTAEQKDFNCVLPGSVSTTCQCPESSAIRHRRTRGWMDDAIYQRIMDAAYG